MPGDSLDDDSPSPRPGGAARRVPDGIPYLLPEQERRFRKIRVPTASRHLNGNDVQAHSCWSNVTSIIFQSTAQAFSSNMIMSGVSRVRIYIF